MIIFKTKHNRTKIHNKSKQNKTNKQTKNKDGCKYLHEIACYV